MADVDVLSMLTQQFTQAVDNAVAQASRDESELHRQYYDGIQWTATELGVLKARNQAPIVDNRIKDKVEHLLGLERRTRTDPKAFPRNPQDEKAAEAASDALRFVADSNEFQQIKSLVAENMLIEGCGACEVVVERGSKYPNIKIRRIRWDRFYYDPFSRENDFSDATYMGIVTWMDADVAKQRWPKSADKIAETMVVQANAETYEDRPRWVDGKRKRVQVFETYYRNAGEWWRAVWFKGGILEEAQPSYYVDPDGVRENCIIAQSLYVDNEGARYGIVRRYKTLQDEVNHRRSKALHILSTRNVVAEKGAVDDVNEARKQLARPDGYVEVTPGLRFDVVPNTDMAEGQFRLLIDAMGALAVTGPNAALQGTSGNISGRAKQLDQEGGAIQLGIYLDALRYFQRRVMRHVWSRVRQFWDQEMWIRVRDEEGQMMFVALNQRITKGELEAEKLAKANIPPEQKAMMIEQIAANPESQVVVIKNNLADLDVDIIIDEAPDTVNIQAEQFEQFVLLAKAGVIFPPKAYIEASMLRNKQKYIDMLSGGDDPAVIAAQQKQQRDQEDLLRLEKTQRAANVKKTLSEANENDAEAAVSLATAAKEMSEPKEKSSPD